MELNESICPICQRDIKGNFRTFDYGAKVNVDCPFCGSFKIMSHILIGWLSEKQKNHDPDFDMSIALRHLSLGSTTVIELTDKNYDDIKHRVRIPSDPLEVLDLLMIHCGRLATRFNVGISIPETDIPLLFVHDDNEMQAILVMAIELEFIGQYHFDKKRYTFSLLVKGWERIAQLRKVRSESKQVFVAMKFGDPELDKVFDDAILPAVEICGYHAYRIDKDQHNDKICDKIIAEIKQSAFLIADFSGHRGGVYFEAGFAKGLGIPVIWTCREDDFDNLHFDTRQFNHIKWSCEKVFRDLLVDRIRATIFVRVPADSKKWR